METIHLYTWKTILKIAAILYIVYDRSEGTRYEGIMIGKHTIELFTSGCPLCKEQEQNLREAVAEKGCGCEIQTYTCEGDACCSPTREYKIKAVPTTVIDGKIAFVGKAPIEEIKAVL